MDIDMDLFVRVFGCWLTCLVVCFVACSSKDSIESASSPSQKLSIQVVQPTCKKSVSGQHGVFAIVANSSPVTIVRLDIDVVLTGSSPKSPVAKTTRTFLFSSGIKPNESREIQFPIESESIVSHINKSDLELMLCPTQIHIVDTSGNTQISRMNGFAMTVVRDWMTPTGDLRRFEAIESPTKDSP